MTREIHLASRPRGLPTAENFALVQVDAPPLADGQVRVRNLYLSVDPYMRGRMNDVKSYTPPFQIGQPLEGGAVGEVVESRAAGLEPGDVVTSMRGWRDAFVADAHDVRLVSRSVEPLSAYLGVVGATGLTAWVGLNLVDVKAGDRVFVSGAAGAVGSVAGQLARLRGCRVVGSAGSAQKVKVLVDEFGFDAAFNYKNGDLTGQLKTAAPDGIDVYFDNVGGDHLEAALSALRTHGRIIACGAISKYNDTAPTPGPSNLALVVTKRLTMRGFIVSDSFDRLPEFVKEVSGYLAQGTLRAKETVVEGLERAPEAFLDLLRGENIGKMIIKLTALILAILMPGLASAQTPASIAVDPTDPTIRLGQSASFKATGTLTDGSTAVFSSRTPLAIGGEGNHACVRLTDGGVRCWGTNAYGQLGDGTTAASSTPVTVSGITSAIAVAAGDFHACAALSDGSVRCWGNNEFGQLGNGTNSFFATSTPGAVIGIVNAIDVVAGGSHTCALLADRTVRCWGRNALGQLGNGSTDDTNTPAVPALGVTDVAAIAAGRFHTCAVEANGGMWCWGRNTFGQLGDGTTTGSSVPVSVSGISSAVAAATNVGHTCAVLADGTVRCWGRNNFGELGNGTTVDSLAPVSVNGITDARAVAAGISHTCALLSGGGLRCWGLNGSGQLGDGTTTNSSVPVTVTGSTTWTAVSNGRFHTCALAESGTASCWGRNDVGQLGDGTTSDSATPVGVTGIADAIALGWTSSNPGAATIDGTGRASAVAAGVTTITVHAGTLSASTTLTVVSALVVELRGFGSGHVTSVDGSFDCAWTCEAFYAGGSVTLEAHRSPGSVFAGWGGACSGTGPCILNMSSDRSVTATFNAQSFTISVTTAGSGQVTSPAGITCGATCSATLPIDTDVILTATPDGGFQLAGWGGDCAGAGTAPTCSLTIDGAKSVTSTFTAVTLTSVALSPANPVVLAGTLRPFTATGTFSDGSTRRVDGSALESGDAFTCALRVNGTVKCWGGITFDPVPGIGTAVSLAAGTSHACAVLAGGSVKCWAASSPPAAIVGVSSAVAVVAGTLHSCALLSDGTVTCWGDNVAGQLGDPATTGNSSSTPVTVAGVTDAIAISSEGGQHTCVVITGGTIRCWGSDGRGQLGDGPSSPPFATATTVSGITNATAVAAGAVHTCALLVDGHVKCWGDDYYGELGDGNFNVGTTSPIDVLGITSAIAIGAGDVHACTLLAGGTVSCWGASVTGSFATPQAVPGLTTATAIATGDAHTCAVVAAGGVRCWGNNVSGQLGDGTRFTTATPVSVIGLSTAQSRQWSSSNASVGRMDAYGRAYAQSVGSSTINVSVAGVGAGTSLTVVNTPAGTNVTVQPVDAATGTAPVTITFSQVAYSGTTILAFGAAPPPPATFQLGNPPVYYHLTTSATPAPGSAIEVCIDYTGIAFSGSPRLFHFESGAWVDRTTSVDAVTHTVCGDVTSLSPFALFEPAPVTPPAIRSVTASPNVLWPPNHALVPVTIAVALAPASGAATCAISGVTSNEPQTGGGDGDRGPDWQITGNLTLKLRAERSAHGAGRVYTIAVRCTDGAGRTATSATTVRVAHHP